MGVYLEDHRPARKQFRQQRRAAVTGAIVIHTAENNTDTDLPDGGAEAVARFVARRSDAAGSYHSVVDADSVVRLGRYEWEMFHDGTGGNRWSLGLSFACRASQWPNLPSEWTEAALRNGAAEAARMARWVKGTVGVDVPAERMSSAQYRSTEPGFVGHGDIDPGRRSDPGVRFPWEQFLALYDAEMGSDLSAPTDAVPSSPMLFHEAMAEVDELYRAYQGYRPSLVERRSWGRDLAEKMYSNGEDPRPTLAFIEFALRSDLTRPA